ncbi:hypothetical protein MASR2M78_35210 [Treponema sp.]
MNFMNFKIKRSWLMATTASIGVFMILYTLARQFLGFNLGEKFEKNFFDFIFIAAIALLVLNRKIANDEKKEAALAAEEELKAAQAVDISADEDSQVIVVEEETIE